MLQHLMKIYFGFLSARIPQRRICAVNWKVHTIRNSPQGSIIHHRRWKSLIINNPIGKHLYTFYLIKYIAYNFEHKLFPSIIINSQQQQLRDPLKYRPRLLHSIHNFSLWWWRYLWRVTAIHIHTAKGKLLLLFLSLLPLPSLPIYFSSTIFIFFPAFLLVAHF